jgi:hypothetical protein
MVRNNFQYHGHTGADPGLDVRVGAALSWAGGPERGPGGGPRGETPGNSWILEILQALKHVSQEVTFQYISLITIHKMTQNLKSFGLKYNFPFKNSNK